MFCALRSSIILSIQVFLCLPRLRVPSTCPYRATAGSLLSFILVTCPNHVSLLFLILSTTVSLCPSSSRLTSFRILSLLLLPSILRSQLISATSNLLSSSLRMHQHSDPCSSTGMTKAPYSFIFVLVDMLFPVHILFSLPNMAHAKPILRLMSFVHRPSSVIIPPKYTHSVTCSSALFSIGKQHEDLEVTLEKIIAN